MQRSNLKKKVLTKNNLMPNKQVKGFTLIELLIVIGIIAILATVVILTLNPAELLRQARDSTRTSDLATLKSALSLYGADVSSPNYGSSTNTVTPASGWCFTSISSDVNGAATSSNPNSDCGGRIATVGAGNILTRTEANKRNVDGTTGWVPVNLNLISSGAPISALPVDPTSPNTAGSNRAGTGGADLADDRYYTYATDGTGGFVITTVLESTKFASSSANDGGPNSLLYEVGTDPGLNL